MLKALVLTSLLTLTLTACASKEVKIYVVPEIPEHLFKVTEQRNAEVATFRQLIAEHLVVEAELQQCNADKVAVKKILDAFDKED